MRLYATEAPQGLIPIVEREGAYYRLRSGALWAEGVAELHAAPDAALVETAAPTFALPATAATKILCVGLNYLDHAAEGKQAVPEHPVFFIRYLSSFALVGADLVLPRASAKYDFEAELGVVIGRRLRNASPEAALQGVFGYMLGMDGSVRDFQKRTPQWTLGKNFDRSGALSPWIVPAATLPEGAKGLRIQSRVNGTLMQDDTTEKMLFDVARLVSSLSEAMTLHPGDILLTGTPAGVGFARTPPIYLKAGDTVEVSIEKIGTMTHRVVAEG